MSATAFTVWLSIHSLCVFLLGVFFERRILNPWTTRTERTVAAFERHVCRNNPAGHRLGCLECGEGMFP